MPGVNLITFIIVGLNMTLLAWFLKAFIGSLWLYLKERQQVDLVITILFGGFALERAFAIGSSLLIYRIEPPVSIFPGEAYYFILARMLATVVANLACLVYDIAFFRYRANEGNSQDTP